MKQVRPLILSVVWYFISERFRELFFIAAIREGRVEFKFGGRKRHRGAGESAFRNRYVD